MNFFENPISSLNGDFKHVIKVQTIHSFMGIVLADQRFSACQCQTIFIFIFQCQTTCDY